MSDKPIIGGGLFAMGKDTNVNKNNNVNNVDIDTNKVTDKSVNKNVNIVINKKKEEVDDIIRTTYYLRISTIKKIKRMSRVADMGVSEFLQTVLDSVIDNIDIK